METCYLSTRRYRVNINRPFTSGLFKMVPPSFEKIRGKVHCGPPKGKQEIVVDCPFGYGRCPRVSAESQSSQMTHAEWLKQQEREGRMFEQG